MSAWVSNLNVFHFMLGVKMMREVSIRSNDVNFETIALKLARGTHDIHVLHLHVLRIRRYSSARTDSYYAQGHLHRAFHWPVKIAYLAL